MIENQTYAGRDLNLKHAAKLLGIYERQMAALDKHRGRGEQSVTVKYVHVGQGGQAIVGNVSQSDAPRAGRSTTPKELEAPMDLLDAEARAPELTPAAETDERPAQPPVRGRHRRAR